MVDLEACCLSGATILSEEGVTLGWGLHILVILVPSSCCASATVLVSCTGDPGGHASL